MNVTKLLCINKVVMYVLSVIKCLFNYVNAIIIIYTMYI